MTKAARDLLKRALKLSPRERAQLAEELLDSIEDARESGTEDDPDPAFVAKLRRRVDRALSGESEPGEDHRAVLDRLQKRHEGRNRTPKR
jgi:hypothetical protein